MRWLFVMALSSCIPGDVQQLAQTTLHSGHKRTHLYDHDVIGGYDVWTFCRDERNTGPFGDRSYDGMCIVLTCPPNAPASRCDSAPR